MKAIEVHIKGDAPMIMQSSQLVDPLNETTRAIKRITAKKTNKTDDDHARIGELEWIGALYWHPEHGPIMPAVNIERMLCDAGKLTRLGTKVKMGMQVLEDYAVVEYDGPRDIAGMRAEERFRSRTAVVVNKARVMRERPRFPEWDLRFTVQYDASVFSPEQVQELLESAGKYIGLGTWRPRHGRFHVVKIKKVG